MAGAGRHAYARVKTDLIATVANYLVSVMLAFRLGRFSRHVELTGFLVVVLVGLKPNVGKLVTDAGMTGIEPGEVPRRR